MGNTVTNTSTLGRRGNTFPKTGKRTADTNQENQQENSRMLFLMYLINKTWNVVVDSVDPKIKR